jgi:uncharacterized protein (TIGR02001 family)
VILRFAFVAVALLAIPETAGAQTSASVTISSDQRFRGRSVSRGDPAVTLNLLYDHVSGLYLGAAATASVEESRLKIINVQGDIGFVHRLAAGSSLDIGVVRSNYGKYSSGERNAHYTEFYAGVLDRRFAVYVHYSPDYFQPGVSTLYTEVDGAVEPATDWRLTGHLGALARVTGSGPPGSGRIGYDWRIAAAHRTGPVELELALSGGGPMPERYEGKLHRRTAVTVSLTWSP